MPLHQPFPVQRLAVGFDRLLALWLRASLAALAAAALVSVLASYGAGQSRWLGQSLTWWQELTAAAHASLLFFAASHGLARGQHLRIDLLYARWSIKSQQRADRLFAGLGSLPLMLLVLTTALPWAWRSWSRLEVSANPAGLAALYLVKSLLVLAAAYGVLVALVTLLFGRRKHMAKRQAKRVLP